MAAPPILMAQIKPFGRICPKPKGWLHPYSTFSNTSARVIVICGKSLTIIIVSAL